MDCFTAFAMTAAGVSAGLPMSWACPAVLVMMQLSNAKSPSGFIAEALEVDGKLDMQMPRSTPVEGSLSNKVRGS